MALIVVLSLCVGILAVWHPGVSRAEVNLHDGGVWVTNGQLRLVAHLSFPSRTLDGGLRAPSPTFDLTQNANEVFVHDQATPAVLGLDPARLELGSPATLPAGALVQHGGTTLAVADPAKGSVWVLPTTAAASFSAEAVEPAVTKLAGMAMAVGVDGSVHAVSALTRRQVSLLADGEGGWEPSETALPTTITTNAQTVITAVGDVPVWLDRSAGVLHLPDAQVTVPDAATAVLQQPGPAADDVLVATGSALLSVPLDGGDPRTLPANPKQPTAKGIPLQPVRLNGCSYAAWTGSGRYRRDCAGTAADDERAVPELTDSKGAVFRVNRNVVVINDTTTGLVFMVDEDMTQVANWQQIDSQLNQQDDREQDTTVQQEQAAAERTADNHPPQATDDEYGVRPGRTTTLPVLFNDTDVDGDVLTAAASSQPSIGAVTAIRDGRALQLETPDTATGTATFGYTAGDGRGEPAAATVTVSVHDWTVNDGPTQLRPSTVVVEQGGSAGTAVLGDWIDPDGDAIYLASATAPEGVTVQTREDGTVEVRDLATTGPGRKQITVTVSDGRATTEGTLTVDVRPPAAIPPVANPDHVRVIVGQDATVRPLDNDTDANGDPLRLAQLTPVPGLSVTPNYEVGTAVVQAAAAGTSYLPYVITDGPSTTTGVIRVDAIVPEETAKPVPENDLGFLPAGGDVLIDLVGNDFDPSGRVLVVQSVTVPADGPLTVEVIEHHLARVSAPAGLTEQTSFTYQVSNGSADATGEVAVVPLAPVPSTVPPVAAPDAAVVRAGDVVTVPVLDNDVSPAGLDLSLDPKLQTDLAPGQGEAFVSQNTVRLKAGDQPGRVRVTYTIRDTQGNFASAEVSIDVRAVDTATNVAPNPQPLVARVLQGSTVLIPVPVDGIDPDGDSVILTGLDSAPQLGTVLPKGAWLEYTAPKKATGMDTFSYAVEDRFGARATATVRVGIAPPAAINSQPVAVTDTVIARTGRTLAVPVLANDVDPDGDTLTLVDGSAAGIDTDVEVTITSSRLVLVTPDRAGVVSFSYEISDGRGGNARGVLSVDVRPDAPLLAPIARDDLVPAADVAGKTTVPVDVLINDEDPDGDSGALRVASSTPGVQVVKGRLQVPVADERQVLTYTVTDVDDLVATAVVVVPGRADQRPTLDPKKIPAKVKSGEPLTVPLGDYVVVRDGRTPRLTLEEKVQAATGWDGQPLVVDSGTVRFVSDKKFVGKTSVTFEVTDGSSVDDPQGAVSMLTLPIEVEGTGNTPPTFTPSAITVAGGEPAVETDLTELVFDPDVKDRPKFSLGDTPPGFTVDLSGSVLTVAAAEGATVGTLGELAVTVDDGYNEVQGVLPLSVTGTTRPRITTTDAVISDARAGQAQTVDVLQYATNPYADLGKPLTMSGVPEVVAGSGKASVTGTTVTVTPAADFHGELTVTYTLADASGQPERNTQGRILISVRDKPDPPTGVSASTRESRSAVVTWTAGSNNGAEITGFTVRATGGGTSQNCGQVTTCTITGLTNNQTYAFEVIASNAVGDSDPSAASNSVRPDVRPNTPAAPTAEFGDRSATVTWTAPSTEGSPVTGYTLRVSGPTTGATETPVTGTSYTWSNLTNGASYTFSVQARSSAEEPSDWSPASTAVVPAGKPAVVASVQAVPAPASALEPTATVSWTMPDGNGDSNLTWTVRNATTNAVLQTGSGTSGQTQSVSTTMQVSTTDQSWQVQVRNKAGDSDWSAASNPVRPYKAPGAVGGLTANPTGANQTVQVSFSAADPNGALPDEVAYYWRVNGSGRNSIGRSGGQVSGNGLVNGQQATIEVWAESTVDGNPPVPGQPRPVTVTPYGPPIGPSMGCSGGDQSVTCSWSGGDGNGRNTRYYVSESQSGGSEVGPSGSQGFPGIGYSATRQLCVQARQDGGQVSGWSCASGTSNPPPPTVTVSEGDPAQGQPGCSSVDCRYVVVTTANFPGGVSCSLNSQHGSTAFRSWTQGPNERKQTVNYYGYPNEWVEATCNGVSGRESTWNR